MRVFFATRWLCQQLQRQEEKELPLTDPSNSASQGDIVDLNNCDLVSCSVTIGEKSNAHFMVVTENEFLLVNPDHSKIGWGIVHFISFLQDVDVATDPANSCTLFITVHSHAGTSRRPALSARFQFEDHIRCVAARQCLQRNRENLRLAKMTRVAKMLHLPIPDPASDSLHCPVEQPDVGSFVAISPAQQLPSHLGDLTRSGLHRALQDTLLPDSPPSQDIEMAHIQQQGISLGQTAEAAVRPAETPHSTLVNDTFSDTARLKDSESAVSQET
jgi:protein CLEC16A